MCQNVRFLIKSAQKVLAVPSALIKREKNNGKSELRRIVDVGWRFTVITRLEYQLLAVNLRVTFEM